MKFGTWFTFAIIFIFSAIYVFKHEKYTKRIEIVNGYTVNFSVNRGQDLEFYLNPQESHKKGVVCIYDIRHQVVDSLILALQKQAINNDTLLYEHGYNYTNKYTFNTSKLKSGIYFIGNVVPFIVKEPELKNAITVVFPFANFHTWSNIGGKSFSKGNSTNGIEAKRLSLNRNPYLSNNPIFFINWLDSITKGKNLNLISDLDLESFSNINNTSLLIFFGNMGFGTHKQKSIILNYSEKGRNILAICSRLMNFEMKLDTMKKQIEAVTIPDTVKRDQNFDYFNNLRLLNPLWDLFVCDYRYLYGIENPKISNSGFKIVEPNHKIFSNISNDFILFENSNGTALPVENINFNLVPKPDNLLTKFQEFKFLAYDYHILYGMQSITGIFEIKRNINSGKTIVIGNEKWCYEENLKSSQIEKVTINAINYLTAEH
jgi:hypothetical protein